MAYQEVYTSYIIPLDQFITDSIERDVMFMADYINTYNAHSYFTNNTNGFMQSRGKESKEEEEKKESKGMNNNILAIPVAKTKFPYKVANYQFKKRKKRGGEKRGSTRAAKVKETRVGVISK